MVKFFKNIFKWIVNNSQILTLILAVIGFAAVIFACYYLIKRFKSVVDKSNDTSTRQNFSSITNNVIDAMSTSIGNVENRIDVLQQKLNAILDVQSIVYSTIKDETARKNINNLLITAKLAETSRVADLENEIERLKNEISAGLMRATEAVEKSTATLKDSVSVKKVRQQRY